MTGVYDPVLRISYLFHYGYMSNYRTRTEYTFSVSCGISLILHSPRFLVLNAP